MATPTQLANRETWRAALLSGDYEQGQKDLRQYDPNSDTHLFCCLGVALDVIADGTWVDTHMFVTSDGLVHSGALDDEVFDKMFGFTSEEVPGDSVSGVGATSSRDVQGRFIDANDVQGYTFEQIASLIPSQDAATSS